MKYITSSIMAFFLFFSVGAANAQQAGALHQSTLSTWVKADRGNKMATVSSIAQRLGLSTNKDKLREWTVEIVSCVDEVAFEPRIRGMRVDETVVICVQMLKEDGMR